jgi:AraC-like DNA-binding protein
MDGPKSIEAVAHDWGDGDLLSDAAVARTQTHPKFRAAVEAMAEKAIASYEALDAPSRWLLSDLGRASLSWGAAILDTTPQGLTAAALANGTAAAGVCSRGRAIAFVQFAQSRGFLTAEPGPEPWSRRRMTLNPGFMAPLRAQFRGLVEAAALVAPEVADALPRLQTDAGVKAAVGVAALLNATRPDLLRNPGGPFRQIFLSRDGGMRVLQQLLISQAPDRRCLLETAALSRAELARRQRVSRTHVNRLLSDAQAAGALSLPSPNRVVFTPAFSHEVEAYFAGQIQVLRVIGLSLAAQLGRSAA